MRISIDASVLTASVEGMSELATESKKLRSKFLKDATETIAQYASIHHRFESRSNNLVNAIEINRVDDDSSEVSLNTLKAPYATFIHDGTGLWGPNRRKIAIFPRDSGALMFEGRFAKRVSNPGIKQDPFLDEAADSVREQLFEQFDSDADIMISRCFT